MTQNPCFPISSCLLKISLLAAVIYTLAQPLHLPLFAFIPLVFWGGFCLAAGKNGFYIFTALSIYLVISSMLFAVRIHTAIPFRPDMITSIQGVLIQEPSWNSRNDLILTLDLMSAETADSGYGEGSGRVTAFLKSEDGSRGPLWMRGDILSLAGSLHSSQDGRRRDEFYFIADRVRRYSRIQPDPLRVRVLEKVTKASESLGGLSEILLPALLLGLKHPDQDTLNVLFRETGTAHIVALSGFHSGLVALLIFTLLRYPLGFRRAMVAAGGGLVIYLYLAGIKPSLLRAVIMFLIPVAGRLCFRRVELKKVLIASFLFTGLVMPESLHTLSARLSYLALWGILQSGPIIHTFLRPKIGGVLSMGLSASLAAQLWTLPLVLGSFGIWYPAGIPASLVLTPLVTVYMYSGIFLVLLPGFPFLTFLPAALCRFIARLLPVCAGLFGKIPSVASVEGSPGLFLILLFPLLLGAVYRPGGFCGKRRSEFELRFHIRDKSSSGNDGFRTPQTVGAEFSDQSGCP